MTYTKEHDRLKELEVGDYVYWHEYKRPMTVKAKDARYIIISRHLPPNRTQYSILDIVKGVCSKDDRIIPMYGYQKVEDCEHAISDLNDGTMGLSKRSLAKIEDVIDLNLTFQKFNERKAAAILAMMEQGGTGE